MVIKLQVVIVCGFMGTARQQETQFVAQELETVIKERFSDAQTRVYNYLSAERIHPGWIRAAADHMLHDLVDDSGDPEDASLGNEDRDQDVPTVFIAYNFGGCIVKQALFQAANNWRYHAIALATRAICFIETPHRETLDLPWEVQLVQHLVVSGTLVSDWARIVESTSAELRGLSQDFTRVAPTYRYTNCYTEQPSKETNSPHESPRQSPFILGLPLEKEVILGHDDWQPWSLDGGPIIQALQSMVNLLAKAPKSQNDEDLEYRRFLGPLSRGDEGLHQLRTHSRTTVAESSINEDEVFQDWLNCQSSSILLLQGTVGSGTTTCASEILQQLQQRPDAGKQTFVSFCCDRQYQCAVAVEGLLMSLCRQLLIAQPAHYKQARPLCEWIMERSLFTKEFMWVLLRILLSAHAQAPVYLFITRLEESDCDWDLFMRNISSSGLIPTALKFVFTTNSRDLTRFQNLSNTFIVDLDRRPWMVGIVRSLALEKLRRSSRGTCLLQKAENQIFDTLGLTATAGSSTPLFTVMQQLAILEISMADSTTSSLAEQLARMPTTLTDLYQHGLSLIPEERRSWAQLALQCVSTVIRPIKTAELAIVLAVQTRKDGKAVTAYNLDDYISVDVAGDLLFNPTIARFFSFREDRVYPVHESLSHFLSTPSLHMGMLRACIDYLDLVLPEMEAGVTQIKSVLERTRYQFLPYAVVHWQDHYKRCKSVEATQIVLRLFESDDALSMWGSFYNNYRNLSGPLSPLSVACELGLEEVVNHIVLQNKARGTIDSSLAERAFVLSAREGNVAILEFLATQVSISNGTAGKAIAAAAASGHVPVIDYICTAYEAGTDLDAGHQGLCPLLLAVEGGHLEAMLCLLERGASLDVTTPDGLPVLHLAVRSGQLAIFRELVDRLVKLEGARQPKNDTSPSDLLLIAASSGFQDIFCLLLCSSEHSISTKNNALYTAARNGQTAAVKILLDNEADPEALSMDGHSSLSIACQQGFTEIVEMILQFLRTRSASHTSAGGHDNEDGPAENNSPIRIKDIDKCLRASVLRGHHDIVTILLREPLDPQSADEKGDTALHHAVSRGDDATIMKLLNGGFQPNSTNNANMTTLQLAASFGHACATRLLLNHDASIDSPREGATTTLELAVQEGHADVVSVLVSFGARPSSKELHLAASNGHDTVVRVILSLDQETAISDEDILREITENVEHGSSPSVIRALLFSRVKDRLLGVLKSKHLLHKARNGPTAELLVEAGFSVDDRDDAGDSTIHRAAYEGWESTLKVLLEAPSDPDIRNHLGNTPLFVAAEMNRLVCAEMLLLAGADVDARNGESEKTALYAAAFYGHVEVVKALLKANADTTIVSTNSGWTPLHAAYDNVAISEVLLEANKDLAYCQSEEGSTPLMVACSRGYVDVVELLIRWSNLDERDHYQSTALHRAFDGDNTDIVTEIAMLLIDQKADVEAYNKDGDTVLHLAASNLNVQVVRTLLEKMQHSNYLIGREGNTVLGRALDTIEDGIEDYPNGIRDCIAICELLISHGAKLQEEGDKLCHLLRGAVDTGDLDLVIMVLDLAKSNDIARLDDKALVMAIEAGEGTLIKPLLDRGSNPDPTLDNEDSLIHIAVRRDMRDAVEALIEMNGKISPWMLIYAAEWQSYNVTAFLLQWIRENREDVNAPDEIGQTLIHHMILLFCYEDFEHGFHDIIEQLLELGADPNIADSSGQTPFLLVISYANSPHLDELAELMLRSRADPRSQDLCHRDAVYWSCCTRGADLVPPIFTSLRKRLAKEDDWKARCSKALHAAVEARNIALATHLIQECGATCDEDVNGWTIHYTARCYGLSLDDLLMPNATRNLSNMEKIVKSPSYWNVYDKHPALEVDQDKLTVRVKNLKNMACNKSWSACPGLNRALIRADYCMPGIGKFYFEVMINNSYGEKITGVGFCGQDVPLNRMVGWNKNSWGYHGDDGHSFEERGWGERYGGTYHTGDVVACLVDFADGTARFYKNEEDLGIVFRNLKGKLYPAVSFDTEMAGGSVTAVFKKPFKYNHREGFQDRADDTEE